MKYLNYIQKEEAFARAKAEQNMKKDIDFSRIAEYMEKTIVGEHGIPGCSIEVVMEHETLYRHTCGYSKAAEKIPLTESNQFFMYSCTKPLTVTAGMRLVEEGKMSLDAEVGTYLPAFRDVYLMKDGKKVKPEHPLLLRNLFTMTGGFDYDIGNEVTGALIKQDPNAKTAEIVDTFAARPLCFEPGDHFEYSLCHDILASVIETVSGKKFSEYLSDIIFRPLEMENSTFTVTDAVLRNLSGQYVRSGAGDIVPMETKNPFRLTECYESGGAGLISTVSDYARFADTMACGGSAKNGYRLLKPETVRQIYTEQLHTFVAKDTFACSSGAGYGYGLGVRTRINQDEGQRSPVGEFGWDGAAGAYVMMDPVNHLSVTYAMHVLGWTGCAGSDHGVLRDTVYDILGL